MKATDITAQNNLRFGYVSDYDEKKHAARVLFPDMDNLISGWLMICVPNSKHNQVFRPLDINEHVACFMLNSGTENGVIIGSVYDDSNYPRISGKNIHSIYFNDGTEITYNTEEHKLQITNSGELTIECAGNINIHSDNSITLKSGGELKVDCAGDINIRSGKIINVEGDKVNKIERLL